MKPKASFAIAVSAWALLAIGCDDSSKKGGGGSASTASTGTSAPLEIPSAAVAAAPSAPLPRTFRAGPGAMIIDCAQILDLDDAKRAAIDKMSDQLDLDEDDSPSDELKSLHDDLVAGVRAGTVDATKLMPRVTALQKVMQGRLDKEAAQVNALFASLTPEQRKALIEGVQRWRRERDEDLAKQMPDGGAESPALRAKLLPERMKKELDLDAAQQAKMGPVLAKLPPEVDTRGEAKQRLDALLTAFDAATFDAKKLDAFGPAAAKARVPADREVQFLAAVVPLLKSEQRLALAGRLEGERLRAGTGVRGAELRDWPFPFEMEPGVIVSGPTATKPKGKPPKGVPSR